MFQNPKPTFNLEFKPLTPERWPDFEVLFGPRGAVGGCWCMWWKLKRSEFDRQKGEANRLAVFGQPGFAHGWGYAGVSGQVRQ